MTSREHKNTGGPNHNLGSNSPNINLRKDSVISRTKNKKQSGYKGKSS